MQAFTADRDSNTPDQIWLTEHPPVYTLGLNRKNVTMPLRNDIPVVLVDRGGKMTYHGPGQVIIYLLVDLQRKELSVRQLVSAMETAITELLAEQGVPANVRADAPGVYVNDHKIASLGLRLKNNCCYHGLSVNVAMDLSPFDAIDPCGYRGLRVTQTSNLQIGLTPEEIGQKLLQILADQLSYEKTIEIPA